MHKAEPDIIEPEEFKKYFLYIIKAIKKKGIKKIKIKYAGGEPTLALIFNYLSKIHKIIKDYSSKYLIQTEFSIISNGVSLNLPIIQLLKKMNIHAAISIDGWGKIHNKTRSLPSGEGTFKRVKNSIELLYKNKNSFNISIVVHKENLSSLQPLIKFAFRRKKAIPVKINFVRDNPNSEKSMMPSNNQLIKHIKKLIDLSFELIIKHNHSPMLLENFLDYVSLSYPKNFVCEAGRYYITLKKDGFYSSCHMLLEDKTTRITKNFSLEELNKKLMPKRLTVDQKKGCKSCEIRYICGGGCPILTKYTYGIYNHPSPYCEAYKKLSYYTLSKIAEIYVIRQNS